MDFQKATHIEPVSYTEAQRKSWDYLCSTCWKELRIWPQENRDHYLVLCSECGEDTRGYTHKSQVERKRTEDHFNALEVKRAYPSLDPNPKEKKSAEDNINDLGY